MKKRSLQDSKSLFTLLTDVFVSTSQWRCKFDPLSLLASAALRSVEVEVFSREPQLWEVDDSYNFEKHPLHPGHPE